MDRKKAMFAKLATRELRKWINVLTIDPGVHSTGWAYWQCIDRPAKKGQKPFVTGVEHTPQKASVESCCERLCTWLMAYIDAMDVRHVVIEFPELWTSSGMSMASGSTGALFKLTYLVGGLGSVVRTKCGNYPILVKPKEWKGQMPKDVVLRRIKRALGIEPRDHEADAIGIGLAIQEQL